MATVLATIYTLAVAGISVYGFLGLFTLWLYQRHRHDPFPRPQVSPSNLPAVTVQLPIYNERYVVARLIEAAVALDYPASRLQIQVVDDSTDDTTAQAAELVHHYRQKGINISLVHRRQRQGYKAGALANALKEASGDYIAIFDADFQPAPDFLQQTIPHFLQEPQLGMVQARWGHLNSADSSLTAAQAIAIDKHFAMEQTVRYRANLFPKFNGAAGIWRRTCLEEAGGWKDDTVCEDLCLSTRAVLKGWQFRFLIDIVAPAELPTTISAYKNQQARWAKGSLQCLLKYGPAILAGRNQTLVARLYALFSMSAYLTHPLLLILLLLQLPLIYLDYHFSSYMFLFSLAGVGQPLLFALGQRVLYGNWQSRLRYLPVMFLVSIGIAASNTRALLQIFFSRHHPFVRTPKGTPSPSSAAGQSAAEARALRYRFPFDPILLLELGAMAYAGAGIVLALVRGNSSPLFILLICLLGFSYVIFLSFQERG